MPEGPFFVCPEFRPKKEKLPAPYHFPVYARWFDPPPIRERKPPGVADLVPTAGNTTLVIREL